MEFNKIVNLFGFCLKFQANQQAENKYIEINCD